MSRNTCCSSAKMPTTLVLFFSPCDSFVAVSGKLFLFCCLNGSDPFYFFWFVLVRVFSVFVCFLFNWRTEIYLNRLLLITSPLR